VKILNYFKKVMVMLLILALAVGETPCKALAAETEPATTVMIEVTGEISESGDVPKEGAEFTIMLESENDNSPIPYTDTLTLEVKGDGGKAFDGKATEASDKKDSDDQDSDGTDAFEIDYTQEGVYYYKVQQVDGGLPNYTYDTTVYHVKVQVVYNEAGELVATQTVRKNDETEKSSGIVFVNEYTEPEPTPTPEPTATPTPEPTATPTPEPTATPTPEPTATPTPEPTATPTPEPTSTPTPEPTATPTPEPTSTPTPEPTATPTPEPTSTPMPEPTATPEPEPTATPEPEPTATPEPEPTATPEPEPTATPEPEPTATPEPTVTPEPTATPEPEATPTPEEASPTPIPQTPNEEEVMGKITVTKRLGYLDQEAMEVIDIAPLEDTVYYFGIFLDSEGTIPYGDNYVKAVHFKGSAVETVEFDNLTDQMYYIFETDASGNVIPVDMTMADSNGKLWICTMDNGTSQEVEIARDEGISEGSADFLNEYFDWPDGYYVAGYSLSITKNVLSGNTPITKDGTTFYAGVFLDEEGTELLTVVELVQNGTVTLDVPLTIGDVDDVIIVYVYETDQDGNLLDQDSLDYTIDGEGGVEIVKDDVPGEMILTNTYTPAPSATATPTPTISPNLPNGYDQPVSQTTTTAQSTGGTTEKESPKTGDDTPVGFFIIVIMAAALAGTFSFIILKKKNERKEN
jgi:pilin isopeptide linkage protein/LPXTG-motif cell wall-anchored protein